jgi:hypothetical protein
MTQASRYRASERALLTELGDGTAVLLDLDSKFYFTLNETAICVWKLLAEREASREQLAAALCREYAVDVAAAGADVDAVLETLTLERLVTVS